jgi:hypothetical protein
MKPLTALLSALLAVVLLAAMVVGVYAALGWAVGALARQDPQIAAPAAIALGLLVAAVVLARAARQTQLRRAAEAVRAERTATYQLFTDLWANAIERGGPPAGPESDEQAAERRALGRLLALYGSPQVLKAHLALRALERERGPADPALRLELGRALLAIRRDLGLETAGLAAEDLQQLLEATPRLPPGQTPITLQDIRPRVSLGPES